MAIFRASNYLASVSMEATNVAQYFTNRMALYRIPERLRLGYVAFEITNFLADAEKELAKVTNINARIDEVYLRQGTNFYKDTNGVALTEKAAKEKILETSRKDSSRKAAGRKANEFVNKLFEMQPHRLESFDKLAADLGFKVNTTEPFDRNKTPAEMNLPDTVTSIGFDLTKDEPISFRPVVGEDAIYVVTLKEILPSEMPPFETIREKVTEDYKNQLAVEAAQSAGRNFLVTLTNSLATNKPFAEICLAARVQPVALPPYSLRTTSLPGLDEQVNFNLLKNVAYNLKPGKASQFLQSGQGGFIIYLRDKQPISDAKMKEDLPEFINTLRFQNQNEAFNEWFRKEAEKGLRNSPLSRPQTTASAEPEPKGEES